MKIRPTGRGSRYNKDVPKFPMGKRTSASLLQINMNGHRHMNWLQKISFLGENKMLEQLAELEHKQWMEWSQSVAPEVSKERRKRWEKLWVPYKDLSEEMKEEDRKYARKILKILK